MKLPDLPPLNHVPSMDLDQFHPGEKAVSELACQNYARLYALAYGEMVREECAKVCEQIAAEEEDASPNKNYDLIAFNCAAAIRIDEGRRND